MFKPICKSLSFIPKWSNCEQTGFLHIALAQLNSSFSYWYIQRNHSCHVGFHSGTFSMHVWSHIDSYLGKLVPFHGNKSSSKIYCRLLCDIFYWLVSKFVLNFPVPAVIVCYLICVPSIRREISMKQKDQVLKIHLSSIPLCIPQYFTAVIDFVGFYSL